MWGFFFFSKAGGNKGFVKECAVTAPGENEELFAKEWGKGVRDCWKRDNCKLCGAPRSLEIHQQSSVPTMRPFLIPFVLNSLLLKLQLAHIINNPCGGRSECEDLETIVGYGTLH